MKQLVKDIEKLKLKMEKSSPSLRELYQKELDNLQTLYEAERLQLKSDLRKVIGYSCYYRGAMAAIRKCIELLNDHNYKAKQKVAILELACSTIPNCNRWMDDLSRDIINFEPIKNKNGKAVDYKAKYTRTVYTRRVVDIET